MDTLYDLTGQFLTVQEMAGDPDADPQAVIDTLESIGGEIEEKADGYARVMANLGSDISAIGKEIDRLKARKKALENNVDAMKARLQASMELTGKTKFRTGLFSFNIQANPASVVLDKPLGDIPGEFLKHPEPVADKQLIKEYLGSLAEGETCGFAHLERSRSLRIR